MVAQTYEQFNEQYENMLRTQAWHGDMGAVQAIHDLHNKIKFQYNPHALLQHEMDRRLGHFAPERQVEESAYNKARELEIRVELDKQRNSIRGVPGGDTNPYASNPLLDDMDVGPNQVPIRPELAGGGTPEQNQEQDPDMTPAYTLSNKNKPSIRAMSTAPSPEDEGGYKYDQRPEYTPSMRLTR